MKKFPSDIKHFVENTNWIFAKTYASTWPHYYIVKEQVDGNLFLKLVKHIREYGYEGRFYHLKITYYEEEGMVYWTMVPPQGHPKWYPPEEEDIVNRCPKESTYEYRSEHGTLPEDTQ
jgi:hypothetical protein